MIQKLYSSFGKNGLFFILTKVLIRTIIGRYDLLS